jgi:hypothetical protein
MPDLSARQNAEIHVITEVGNGKRIPTSGNPGRWPLWELWEGVDLGIVKETLDRHRAETLTASPQELQAGTASSGIYFTPEQRSFLARCGEVSVDFPSAT